MIRGIIFDCFGVLHLDSNSAYFAQFPQHRAALHNLNVRADHGFVDKETYLEEAAALVGVTPEDVLEGVARENTLNQPLADYIKAHLKPHYKIGMLSNVGRGWMENFFDEHQLHDLFDTVVLSNEEGITKPNPLVFTHTAEKLNLSPDECIMIDDRPENCKGAEAAGMKSILYISNEALYDELARLVS